MNHFSNMLKVKYIMSFGNTPEHINHHSKKTLLKLVFQCSIVVRTCKPYPWLMALPEKSEN